MAKETQENTCATIHGTDKNSTLRFAWEKRMPCDAFSYQEFMTAGAQLVCDILRHQRVDLQAEVYLFTNVQDYVSALSLSGWQNDSHLQEVLARREKAVWRTFTFEKYRTSVAPELTLTTPS